MVILPRGKVSTAQLVQPLANGAIVLAVDGDFDDCMAMVKRLAEEEGVYLANSMNSLRVEGQKTVAIEMVQQFDWEVPDWVVIPGGNLGNVSALGAGFLMMKELGLIQKLPRICVAQAAGREPALPRLQGRLGQVQGGHGAADARLGDPDRQPGQRPEGDPDAAEVRRRRRAGVRGRAGRRRGARRSHRACSTARTPASRWRRWRSSSRGGEIRPHGPGRRRQHRQRPQVHRLQGAVPRGEAPGGPQAEVRQPPDVPAQRLRRRARRSASPAGLNGPGLASGPGSHRGRRRFARRPLARPAPCSPTLQTPGAEGDPRYARIERRRSGPSRGPRGTFSAAWAALSIARRSPRRRKSPVRPSARFRAAALDPHRSDGRPSGLGAHR